MMIEKERSIRNFASESERQAYRLGRSDKRLSVIKFIEEWNGDCSTELGQLLYIKFQKLQDKDFFKTL